MRMWPGEGVHQQGQDQLTERLHRQQLHGCFTSSALEAHPMAQRPLAARCGALRSKPKIERAEIATHPKDWRTSAPPSTALVVAPPSSGRGMGDIKMAGNVGARDLRRNSDARHHRHGRR